MATLRTVLELALRGGTETQRQLEQVGKVGAEAFKKIDEGAKKVPASLRAVDAAASQVKGNLEGVAQQLGAVGTAANAVGGLGTIAAAGVVGVGALGAALSAMAKNAADSAGQLVDLSDLTGVSTRTLQAYGIAARGAGVSQEAFAQAIQTFTTNVGQAELGTGKLSSKLKLLDPAFLGVVNSAASVEAKFDLVIAKINELPQGAERAALAVAFFGAEGAKLANVGATVDDVNEKFTALGAVLSDDLLRAADAAGDALDESTAILRAQIATLQTEAAPAILGYEKAWVDGAGRILSGLREILEEIGLINKAADVSFRELSTRRAGLSSELATINADTGRGLETGASSERRKDLEAEIAAIDHWQKAIRDAAKTQKDAADEQAKALKRQHDLRQGELAEVRAQEALQKQIDADRKASASAAEAAQKKATEAHKAGLEAVIELEQKAQTAGLDGIAKLEAERDVAYEKFAELVKKDGLNQEEAARGYLAIWQAADKEITQTREQEEQKRADAAQKAAEKEAAAAKKAAEKAQEELRKPFDNAIENIQRDFGDMFTNIFENGLDGAGDFADQLKHIFARLAGELATLLVIQPVLGSITGTNQAGGVGSLSQLFGGSSGTGIGRLTSGIGSLVGSIFSLDQSTQLATQATQQSTNVFQNLAENDFGFSGIGDNGDRKSVV